VAAGRVRFRLVGLAVHDPDSAAVRLPARYARGKVLVGIGDSFVVFLAVFVFVGVRIGIATAPKLFDDRSRSSSVSFLNALRSSSVMIRGDVFVSQSLYAFFSSAFSLRGLFIGSEPAKLVIFWARLETRQKSGSGKLDESA
jgi:hypothetical protein